MANAHDGIDGLIAQHEGGGSVKEYKEGGKVDKDLYINPFDNTMTKEELKEQNKKKKAKKEQEKYEQENPILSGKKTLKQVTDEGIAAAHKRTKEGIKKQKDIQYDIEQHIDEATGGEYGAKERTHRLSQVPEYLEYMKEIDEKERKGEKIAGDLTVDKYYKTNLEVRPEYDRNVSEYNRKKTSIEKDRDSAYSKKKYKNGGTVNQENFAAHVKEASSMDKGYSEYNRPKTSYEETPWDKVKKRPKSKPPKAQPKQTRAKKTNMRKALQRAMGRKGPEQGILSSLAGRKKKK